MYNTPPTPLIPTKKTTFSKKLFKLKKRKEKKEWHSFLTVLKINISNQLFFLSTGRGSHLLWPTGTFPTDCFIQAVQLPKVAKTNKWFDRWMQTMFAFWSFLISSFYSWVARKLPTMLSDKLARRPTLPSISLIVLLSHTLNWHCN